MKPVMRQYRGEEDYARIRQFLQEVMIANGLREFSWHIARLDYWRWHGILNCGEIGLGKIFIWEKDGKIVSVLNPEGKCHAFIQIHPDYKCSELYGEMLAVAEKELADIGRNEQLKVIVWSDSGDLAGHEILKQRDYKKIDRPEVSEYQNRIDLEGEIPKVSLADGYSIRNLHGMDDLPARAWCSFRAFHPDDPEEKYDGFAWYRNIQVAPLYKEELDLVVVTAENEIVSFCTIWYDEVTRTAYYEPVGTMPEHQKKGLAKANLVEGLRRLKKLGCKRAFMGGHSIPAIATYKSAGFTEHDISEAWEKLL